MEHFVVQGGYPLSGQVTVSGAKNVALKVLIASLLTDEDIEIENVPLVSDLFALAEIIKKLGGKVENTFDHTMRINSKDFKESFVSSHSFGKLRASFLLLVPLLARFGQAKIPLSGGDKIGVRPIDRTISGLEQMGVNIDFDSGYYYAQTKNLTGTHYKFSKNTHTGTEALIMAGSLAKGGTILENAAQEPEIDDLIDFLNKMGARIKRTKPRTIEIKGVTKLHGAKFKIMPDRNEVVTFALAAILTKGKLSIKPVRHLHLDAFYKALNDIGVDFEKKGETLLVNGDKRPIFACNIETAPYPGFMTDWQAPWTLLMTQAEGVSYVHEKVFDNRFGYVYELTKMGAEILPFFPKVENVKMEYNFNWTENDSNNFHAVEIIGPKKLQGTDLFIPDLRAGATLVLAALASEGESRLYGIEHIDRGYEKFADRLIKLGAKVIVNR